MKINRKIFTRQFFKNNMVLFWITMTMDILLAAFNLIVSWIIQQLIDAASGNTAASLTKITLYTLAAFSGFIAAYMIYRITKPGFIQRAMTRYKEYAFSELTKKSIGSFSLENTGKYISALTNDALSIETNYLENIFTFVELIILFTGGLLMMLWYSPFLTAAAILLSLPPVIISVLTGNRLAEEEKQVSSKNETFTGTVKDLLSGFPVIKSFKSENEAVKLFAAANSSLEYVKQHRRTTNLTISFIGTTASIFAQFGVFFFGVWLAVSGHGVTPGVVIVFVQLMNYILAPISQIPSILANRKAAMALIDKLAAALCENVRSNGVSVPPVLHSGISIRNLVFAYNDTDSPVLNGINIRFEAGKSYAIVGGSGSGKSTLLNLLMGSSEKYNGGIYYDDNELRQINSDSLYEILTLVQQNVFIFNDTIRNNVTMFRDFDDDRIARVIEQSGLSDLITAKGEDYICGENGSGLSGGEKQRISIAHALLQGAPVMLIDEATSALDAATAFDVTNAILDIKGLTRIIVTHRLEESLLTKYDEILVLRSGHICEKGTFKELMQRKGIFYSLFTISN